ncbi:malto-oligosyltrehalose synthase [Pusillimonas sp. SM2304]|uniref:malto-oligosyltrehalose synthase n=1 Tax=Pusillimonas sp. SM2304 TaxID=3073241 RepID=UPI002876ED46|nr:malto-oligosyltrehalose synthase [Pusillimonas sp. SM2304]MDS1139331.1 malto-oligosyltrehalose synthase [Pusillimonas sp. SM2304]
MNAPRATARLQLHAGFTLVDACRQVPYYAGLGVSHYYLSPVTRARPGSTHGYDVIDHAAVSAELGGEEALIRLAARLREYGMGLVLDIVPNHMAAHAGNAWWWDVLRHGVDSVHASWFDIDWDPPEESLRGKVLAPFLPDPYEASLSSGAIQLVYDGKTRAFQIDACGARYPVAPDTLDEDGDPAPRVQDYDGRDAQGRRRLHALLSRQHYQLAWWRTAAERINWRRFFEVNELVGVCVERPEVFDAVHGLTLRLYAQGLIDGVRIDHVDGLADPAAYCRMLRARLLGCSGQRPGELQGQAPWLIVEKILAPGERLDPDWQVAGTTGYDFMDQTGAVLHDSAGQAVLTRQWESVARDARDVTAYVREARRAMVDRHFAAERNSVLRAVCRAAQTGPHTRRWRAAAVGRMLDDMLVAFPTYRSYVGRAALPDRLWQEAVGRFQQLTPPLAAKSLEDTVFYRYGRLLSRNEVGSDPAVFSMPASRYHQENGWRAQHAQQSMLATATHDHKRGEDARARLAVLSEVPEAWCDASRRWLAWPGAGLDLSDAVQAGERYMLLQTMVGAWPLDLGLDDAPGLHDFMQRLGRWQVKAMREAKLTSSWLEPQLDGEERALAFLDSLLPGQMNHGLLGEVARFVQQIAPAGAVNSLAQVLLRCTVPGVPDLYQGTEFWDFSLVDPDNRRPVDFAARHAALAGLDAGCTPNDLLREWRSGRIKQAVLVRALGLRHAMPAVFAGGSYAPLPARGARGDRVVAFLRAGEGGQAIAVAPVKCCSGVGCGQGLPLIDPAFWDDTALLLPPGYAGAGLTDVLSGARLVCAADGSLGLADALASLPVALLVPD